jgi:MFS family permease
MRKKWRFVMLFLCSSFVLANYFSYDNPASLEIAIEKEFKVSESQYGLLYTVYAIPNLFLPIFGGILFDKIGTRNGLLIFSFLLCSG